MEQRTARGGPGVVVAGRLRDAQVVQGAVGERRADVAPRAAALADEEGLAAQRDADIRPWSNAVSGGRSVRMYAASARACSPVFASGWPVPSRKCDTIVLTANAVRSGSCPVHPYGAVSAMFQSGGGSRGPLKSPVSCGWTITPTSEFVPPPSVWQPWQDSPDFATSVERNSAVPPRRAPPATCRPSRSGPPRGSRASRDAEMRPTSPWGSVDAACTPVGSSRRASRYTPTPATATRASNPTPCISRRALIIPAQARVLASAGSIPQGSAGCGARRDRNSGLAA